MVWLKITVGAPPSERYVIVDSDGKTCAPRRHADTQQRRHAEGAWRERRGGRHGAHHALLVRGRGLVFVVVKPNVFVSTLCDGIIVAVQCGAVNPSVGCRVKVSESE